MIGSISYTLLLATVLGRWEVVLILSITLILVGAKKFAEIARRLRNGVSEVTKELDRQAEDAGRSAGGIFGKPAAEALTPDNRVAELYEPAAFYRDSSKRSVLERLRRLCRRMLERFRIRF